MMNRRQFIQMTMSLAAAAALPVAAINAAIVPPPPQPKWVPSREEVAYWLEYYKAWTAGLRPDIHDFSSIEPDRVIGNPAPLMGAELAVPMVARFAAFEDAFRSQESDRGQVAREFLAGYDAGKDGSQRYCARFDRPSNAGYAWYHYWQVGDFDRRYAAGDPVARAEATSWRSPAPTSFRKAHV
jgi:hypothetical protein